MAGDWIPMRLNLADDPAVIAVSDATGLDEFAVVGRLHRLWSWANQHTRDGHAPGVTLARIDRQLCHTGFGAALVTAGWLTVGDDGSVCFPRFETWNSNAAKKRLNATRRKHLQRSKDVTHVSRRRHASVTQTCDENVTREEKRREENKESETEEVCPETAKPPSSGPAAAVVLTYPTDGPVRQWPLTEAKLAEYRESYPSLDVLGECRKALQYVRDNPQHRKTATGMPAYLGRWLARCQNRAPPPAADDRRRHTHTRSRPDDRPDASPGRPSDFG